MPAQTRVDIKTIEAEMVLAELAVVVAPGWERPFKDVMGRTTEVKTALQDVARSLKVYAEEAKTAMA